MARTSQDRRRRGAAPQAVMALETAAFLEGDEAGLNGCQAFADTAPTRPLHGCIDEVKSTGIKGGAWGRQTRGERIRLELVEGETRLATVVAREDRPGLTLSGIGDGRHGFSI